MDALKKSFLKQKGEGGTFCHLSPSSVHVRYTTAISEVILDKQKWSFSYCSTCTYLARTKYRSTVSVYARSKAVETFIPISPVPCFGGGGGNDGSPLLLSFLPEGEMGARGRSDADCADALSPSSPILILIRISPPPLSSPLLIPSPFSTR